MRKRIGVLFARTRIKTREVFLDQQLKLPLRIKRLLAIEPCLISLDPLLGYPHRHMHCDAIVIVPSGNAV